MKNLVDRLEEFMTIMGLNNNSLTVKAGLSNGLLATARKTRKSLTSDTIEKILNAFPELNGHWLITGKGDWNFAHLNAYPDAHVEKKYFEFQDIKAEYVPKVITVDASDKELINIVPTKAAAGYLNGYSDPEYISELPVVSLPGFTGRTYRGFEVRGLSMLPNIHPGSLNIGSFVESLDDIKNRRIYILVTKYDGIVVKRVINHVRESGKLILISDNKNKTEFPNATLDPEEVLEVWYWRCVVNFDAPEPFDMYNQFNDLQARVTVMQQQIEELNSLRLNK